MFGSSFQANVASIKNHRFDFGPSVAKKTRNARFTATVSVGQETINRSQTTRRNNKVKVSLPTAAELLAKLKKQGE